MPRDSESPQLSIKPAPSMGGLFDEPSSSVSVLPGGAVADLDWDDDEEATNVFDRSAADLFHDLRPQAPGPQSPGAGPSGAPSGPFGAGPSQKPDVGKAAALLASSGRSAKAIKTVAAEPAPMPMPQIPAPAPVPREIVDAKPAERAGSNRPPHPSWAPAEAVAPPPQKSGSKSTLLLALIAVAVLGAAAFLYLRSSADSKVSISVTHDGKPVEKADIYIDGQKKCEFSPCKLELPPGNTDVRVISGNLAGSQRLEIKGGEDMTVAIKLGVSGDVAPPEPDAPASASAEPEGPATLKLASKMKDVDIKVFVNGKERGTLGKDPLELSDVEPGKVTLRFEGGEKFGKVEKNIELKPGETLSLDDIELPLLEVKVAFELKTRGADVKLVKEDEAGKKEDVKLTFRGTKAEQKLDTSYKWTLVASLKGYDDLETPLEFEAGKDAMDFPIELQKTEDKPEPVATTTDTPQPTGPGPVPQPTASFGFINANSLPPAGVIIDGRPHGTAPVTGVKVSPGSHTVVFRHKDLGTKSRTVTVAAGKTVTAAVRFDAPAPAPAPDPEPAATKKKKKKKKKSSE
ncbi:MAG: PEGA domain-containing protein [Polyangiaceae bacterium]